MFPQDSSIDDALVYNAVMHNTAKGIDCTIYWNSQPNENWGTSTYISFGSPVIHEDDVICDEFLVDDEYIFYYFTAEETNALLDAIANGDALFPMDEWTIVLTEPFDVLYHDSSNPTYI